MRFTIFTAAYNQLPLIKKTKEYLDKQTFRDFEWVIADDGSSDGIKEWVEKTQSFYPIKFVTQEDEGFRLTQILNKAAIVAEGEHYVWVFADSYPKEDFLEQLNRVVDEDRVTNGLRIQVDSEGLVVGNDWRLDHIYYSLEGKIDMKVFHLRPWELMTSNSMSMPARMFHALNGWFEGYTGYGREDWDLVMRAYYAEQAELHWAPQANIYHLQHADRPDTPDNVKLFNKRLSEYQK